MAIMIETLRWLGKVLQMKDDRLQKDYPCQPIVQGQTKSRLSPNGAGGCRERSRGNGKSLRCCRLYEKRGSVPLSRAIMIETLRWLGKVLQMKDDRLLKIILVSQLSRAKQKAGCLQMGREDIGKDQREMENFCDAVSCTKNVVQSHFLGL